MSALTTVRLLLVGPGNLGRRFCDPLVQKGPEEEARYGLRLLLLGAADSRGAAYDPAGLDPARVAALKEAGGSVAKLPEKLVSLLPGPEFISQKKTPECSEGWPITC